MRGRKPCSMPRLALTPRTRRTATMAIRLPPMGRYLALDHGNEHVLIPLRSELVRLGRSVTADIALEDGGASRRHALVLSRPDAPVEVVDDGSLNGTWVNGRRVDRHALSHGDVIRIGRTELRYLERVPELADEATAELPAPRPLGALSAA